MTRAKRKKLAAIAATLRVTTGRPAVLLATMERAAVGIEEAIGDIVDMGRPRATVTLTECIEAVNRAGTYRGAARLLRERGIACSEALLRARLKDHSPTTNETRRK